MSEAVIVSTARTPIGRAYRGGLNDTDGPTLAAHAIKNAVERSGIEPELIEDVVLGCAMQEGTTGGNVARRALLRAGLPVTIAGTTIDRQCSSGLQAIALAARSIMFDGVTAAVAGGVESISLVQNDHRNTFHQRDPALVAMKPEVYMAMIDTAEIVATRYNVSREAQGGHGLGSQRRTAAAQQARRVEAELAPMYPARPVTDNATGELSHSGL